MVVKGIEPLKTGRLSASPTGSVRTRTMSKRALQARSLPDNTCARWRACLPAERTQTSHDPDLELLAALVREQQFPKSVKGLPLFGVTQGLVCVEHVSDDGALGYSGLSIFFRDFLGDAFEIVLNAAKVAQKLPGGGQHLGETLVDLDG